LLDAAEISVVAGVVASRKLWAECPKRGGFEIEVQLGAPYQASDVDWACPVGITGLYEHLADQHGIDSWQALMLARNLARTLLNGFIDDGGRVLVSQGGEVVNVSGLFESGI
jgi:hypothetical protein